MRRLLIAAILSMLPFSAFAFDTSRQPDRIALLQTVDVFEDRAALRAEMTRELVAQLRGRGFDAYVSDATLEDVEQGQYVDADYLVVIGHGGADTSDHGGVGIGGRHAGVGFGLMVSRMAADVLVYDAGLNLVADQAVSKRSTAFVPTSVGIGGGALYAYIALPFIERAQQRSLARAAARDAASQVTAAIRGR